MSHKFTVGAMLPEMLRHLFKKPATVLYPFERLEVPEDFRGKIAFDLAKCRPKCQLCALDCPANAIIMEPREDGQEGTRPVFLLDRCIFCGQCAEACRNGAIRLTKDFELAQYDKKMLTLR